MKSYLLGLFVAGALLGTEPGLATEIITDEPEGNVYSFVSHYRLNIAAPAKTVWHHATHYGSWMNAFDMAHESGTPGTAGEVIRLYAGQDFFMQATAVVPEELLVLSNLPMTMQGEHATGIAVITLNETESGTTIDLTMSRRYSWDQEGENPMKAMRQSAQFQGNTEKMWRGFLANLKELSEAS